MDYIHQYAEFLKKNASCKRPFKVVADASNGTAGIVLKELSGIPNLELVLINETPDPEFSAHGPNPLVAGALSQLSKKVLEEKADLGVAFDADGDRAFFADEKGQALPSFAVAAILFKQAPAPYVADELVGMSLQSMGLFGPKELHVSRIGSFFVKQTLMSQSASLGAEFSGHYYFKDFFGADSGIFTMFKMIHALTIDDRPLSIIHSSLPEHVIANTDVHLKNTTWPIIQAKLEEKFAENSQISRRDGVTISNKDGWMNIRPSNTEPLVRLTAGNTTKEEAEGLLADLVSIISELES